MTIIKNTLYVYKNKILSKLDAIASNNDSMVIQARSSHVIASKVVMEGSSKPLEYYSLQQ